MTIYHQVANLNVKPLHLGVDTAHTAHATVHVHAMASRALVARSEADHGVGNRRYKI